MREPRLGDDIDDFCVRCKRVMNHNIVSVVAGAPAKVRCRTCHSDHDFRNEQPPPPKVDLKKQALFNEVLQKVSPGAAAVVDDPDVDLDLGADVELEPVEAEPEPVEPEPVEPEPIEPEPVVVAAPKPKKAKGRPKK
ncbi:MAG TPA: hypothetical protein VKJ01_19475 [Candidatus Solibacter sp.]|nr:hypothetical protein [Candidatus Solibacter sp.]